MILSKKGSLPLEPEKIQKAEKCVQFVEVQDIKEESEYMN
mgnify:FL=1